MKIGLLTVYYSNYGSYFQAVATAKQLEKMGHECEFIHPSIRGKYCGNYLIGEVGEHILPKFITDQVAKHNVAFRTYHAMRKELDQLNTSRWAFSAKKFHKRYDCVLVGSDILWSATGIYMHFIPAYFGLGVKCPIISYGTSAMTLSNPPESMEAKIIQGMKSFSAISVRDEETQRWVKKWTGKDVPIVIDPTLLNPYFGSMGAGGNGVMVYGEHFSKEHIHIIQQFAKEQGYMLHALCWKHDWCDDFIEVNSAQGLQNAFDQADFCITSTFHGTIFSLLHHRPFAAFAAPLRTEKVQRLLADFGLQDCFWEEKRLDKIQSNVEYSVFDATLEDKRKESLKYLQQAIDCAQTTRKGK